MQVCVSESVICCSCECSKWDSVWVSVHEWVHNILCMWLCVSKSVSWCVSACVCTWVRERQSLCMFECMCHSEGSCVCVYMHISSCTYVCSYVCMCVYVCIYMGVYVSVYIHSNFVSENANRYDEYNPWIAKFLFSVFWSRPIFFWNFLVAKRNYQLRGLLLVVTQSAQ